MAIKQFNQDQNGNQTSELDYGFSTQAVGRLGDGQPTGIGNASLVRTTAKTYGSPPPSGTACGAGFYCDVNAVPIVGAELLTQSISGSSNSTYSAYCYDGHGNTTLEAHGGTSGLTCQNASSNAMTSVAYSYDAFGNPLTKTDALGGRTTYTYGGVGGQSSLYWTAMTDPVGLATSRSPDLFTGLVTSQTGPDGLQTTTGYDALGRPLTVNVGGAGGFNTQYTYNDSLRYVGVLTDLATSGDLKQGRIFRYDALGRVRLSQELEAAGQVAPWTGSPSTSNWDALGETAGILTQHMYYASSTWGTRAAVSTPYRFAPLTADPAEGWAVTAKDVMGRVVSQTYNNSNGASCPTPYTASTCPFPWGSNTSASGTVTTSYLATTASYYWATPPSASGGSDHRSG